MKISALDLGSVTGLCYGEAGAVPVLHSWTLDARGNRYQRGRVLAQLLREHLNEYVPDALYVEAPQPLAGMIQRGTSGDALQALYGYDMVAFIVGDQCNIPVKSVDTQEARRHFIGRRPPKGKGKAMVADRCRVLRWAANNHNESDAAAVWALASALEAPSRWMKAVQEHSARAS